MSLRKLPAWIDSFLFVRHLINMENYYRSHQTTSKYLTVCHTRRHQVLCRYTPPNKWRYASNFFQKWFSLDFFFSCLSFLQYTQFTFHCFLRHEGKKWSALMNFAHIIFCSSILHDTTKVHHFSWSPERNICVKSESKVSLYLQPTTHLQLY